MAAFEKTSFMESLKILLPNANVRENLITPEQREEGRKRLHEINQRQSKAVSLGNGALKK